MAGMAAITVFSGGKVKHKLWSQHYTQMESLYTLIKQVGKSTPYMSVFLYILQNIAKDEMYSIYKRLFSEATKFQKFGELLYSICHESNNTPSTCYSD